LNCASRIQAFNLRLLASERGGRFYQDVAAYGHLDALDLPWERTDKAALLKQALISTFGCNQLILGLRLVKETFNLNSFMLNMLGWKQQVRKLKKETYVAPTAVRFRVPWYARALAAVVVAYALSPMT